MTPKKKKKKKTHTQTYGKKLYFTHAQIYFKQEYTLHLITLIKCQFNPLSLKVFFPLKKRSLKVFILLH